MKEQDNLTIYAVETFVGENRTGLAGQDYHAFLALVEEGPGQKPKIEKELHFQMKCLGLEEGETPYMHAVEKPCGRDMSNLKLHGYIGGRFKDILPAWEKAIEIGSAISALKLEFSQNGGAQAINCRAGLKAVIDGLGLEYNTVLPKPIALEGSEANIVNELPKDIFENTPFQS